jgi:hypothetical protein
MQVNPMVQIGAEPAIPGAHLAPAGRPCIREE